MEIESCPNDSRAGVANYKIHDEARVTGSVRLLTTVFTTLFLQIVLLNIISFVQQTGPVFVERLRYFGLDYYAFYTAADRWTNGNNPYSWPPFFTPPFSVLIGTIFYQFGFEQGRVLYLVLNVAVIVIAAITFARALGLPRHAILLFAFITTAYYPFYGVIERGNVDGFMFACLLFGYQTERRLLRASLLAISTGIKLYTILFFAIFARKRWWALLGWTAAIAIVIELPFLRYWSAFLTSVLRRSEYMRLPQNISPAALFWSTGSEWWFAAFLCFWTVTLGIVVARDGGGDQGKTILKYTPWMVAMPPLVFPHTGILLLAPLALIAKKADEQTLSSYDWLSVAGFILTGVQAVAFATACPARISNFFWLAAPLGTTLIICSEVLKSFRSRMPQRCDLA